MERRTNKNAASSPLLRLILELRNRVYKHVLRGHDIHISFQDGGQSVVHSICLAPQPDVAMDDGAHHTRIGRRHIAHDGCLTGIFDSVFENLQVPLDVSLLQTCKQIHQEAALLPFLLNNFIFERLDHVAKFADKLLAPQRPAVTTMTLGLLENAIDPFQEM